MIDDILFLPFLLVKHFFTECDEPPTIDNAVVGPGKTTVTSTRTYQCVQGYTLSGTGSVICKASGNWTTPGFSCSLCLYQII